MKNAKLLFILVVSATTLVFSQDSTTVLRTTRNYAVTVGVLQGGGSLLGADYERMVGENIGIQIGAGLVGFGAGILYHLEPSVNSSAIALQFWNQGTSGDNLSQRIVGMTYIYRSATSGFTAQLGIGPVVELGKLMDDYYKKKGVTNPPAAILLYSIGWYF